MEAPMNLTGGTSAEIPSLKLTTDTVDEPGDTVKTDTISEKSSITNTSPLATRKALHQNIFGKLRPVPLQYHWSVWYEKQDPASNANFTDKLRLLYEDVSDIGNFFRVYNNYPWDKMRLRDTVHIFRKGTKPVWEDRENIHGGSWTFRVPKAKSEAFFLEIALLCVSNELQAAVEAEHDHILGVSTSTRINRNLISIWHKLGSNENSIKILEKTILERLASELRPTDADSYYYRRHSEREGYQQAISNPLVETKPVEPVASLPGR
jgi:hypothetical protein